MFAVALALNQELETGSVELIGGSEEKMPTTLEGFFDPWFNLMEASSSCVATIANGITVRLD